ncbi:MAG TPA: tetratricopeptide repeat protein, partial [Chloroflexia bacterium]|nr:tetratricopeptide repeat protein [Chloroflexia bacterium]
GDDAPSAGTPSPGHEAALAAAPVPEHEQLTMALGPEQEEPLAQAPVNGQDAQLATAPLQEQEPPWAVAPLTGPDAPPATAAPSDTAAPVPEQLGFRWEPEEAPAPELAAPVVPARPASAVRRWPGLLPAGVGLPLLAITVGATVFFAVGQHWLQAMLILLLGGLLTTHLSGVRAPGQLFGAVLLVVGFGIALGVEYVYLADHLAGGDYYRMNTVFKFYEQVWLLVACGAAIALYTLLGPRGQATRARSPMPVTPPPDAVAASGLPDAPAAIADLATTPLVPDANDTKPLPAVLDAGPEGAPDMTDRPRRRLVVGTPETVTPAVLVPVPARRAGVAVVPARPRAWLSLPRLIWLVPLALLLAGSLIFIVAGTQGRVADRMPGDRPPFGTLDGMAWMDKTIFTLSFDGGATQGPVNFRFEKQALDWLNSHIKGTPVIAAAPREYYREGGMIVGTYTGLPMVVGGLHQDEQRYPDQVGERRDDMNTFFRNPDIAKALLIIQKYDIEYIYLGQIENIGYQKDAGGLAKFQDMAGKYLDVAYQNDLVTIYHVRRPQVAADLGTAPGSAPAAQPTPRPKPTPPALGNDPVLNGLLATIKADPNNLDAHRALADYYRTHNAVQQAIDEYTKVTQLAPQDVAAHHILGDLYMQNQEPDKALAAWEDAVKQAADADKPAAYNKVGLAYMDRQRYDDAITAFKAAVAADPGFAESWFHLGEVYQLNQDSDHARDAFQQCINNAHPDESGKHWAAEAQKRLDSLK